MSPLATVPKEEVHTSHRSSKSLLKGGNVSSHREEKKGNFNITSGRELTKVTW